MTRKTPIFSTLAGPAGMVLASMFPAPAVPIADREHNPHRQKHDGQTP
jgi:hypothetical protein